MDDLGGLLGVRCAAAEPERRARRGRPGRERATGHLPTGRHPHLRLLDGLPATGAGRARLDLAADHPSMAGARLDVARRGLGLGASIRRSAAGMRAVALDAQFLSLLVIRSRRAMRCESSAEQGGPKRAMSRIRDVSHHDIFRHPEHCVNQIATRVVASGEVIAVFNEERFPYHHDSGQTLLTRSADGGLTWSAPEIVLPWSRQDRQLGLRLLRARRRHLAGQPDDHRPLQARHPARGRVLGGAAQHQGMGRLDLGLQDAELARHLRRQVDRPRPHLVASRSRSTSARSSMAAAGSAAGSCPRAAS